MQDTARAPAGSPTLRSCVATALAVWAVIGVTAAWPAAAETPAAPLATDRVWDVLPPSRTDAERRDALRVASWWFVGRPGVEVAGEVVDAARLARWGTAPSDEPLTRVVREDLRRPVDVGDLLLLLDDVLRDDRRDLVVIHAGRARSHGILLHPREVFRGQPRDYGTRGPVDTHRPTPQRWVPPAPDGAPLGVRWTTRYPNPETLAERLDALATARPGSDFPVRVASLAAQLDAQGALVWVTSTVRDPRRGYLLWGSFLLSRCDSEAEVAAAIARLDRANRDWGLDVPIVWAHPEGWEATIRHATAMAETYDVVYATERGARSSNHYGGRSVDLVAIGLPRALVLVGADGAVGRFDLSDPERPRDLSLEPDVIEWVERHFGLVKLETDYPHWTDRS